MTRVEKSIVVLYDDFGKEWIEPIVQSGAKRVGLHFNPYTSCMDDFLRAAERLRATEDALEQKGVAVEYYLHAVSWLLPRALSAKEPELFRQNGAGERTADYNCCPSSARALAKLTARTAMLAARLGQRSHRYHIWQDDDLGGDVRCHCKLCESLSSAAQTFAIAQAMLRGLRVYDPLAEISLLVYGQEQADAPLPDGMFVEFAPFRREHGVPLTQGETNRAFVGRLKKLLATYGADRVEVLEYFLSYDYALFCRGRERGRRDVALYRALGVEKLSTFAVFAQKDYLKTHGFAGIREFMNL